MAGFSTRLREKIESTRINAASGHVPSDHRPKNIRGLTRLSGNGVFSAVSPSGGLLSGRNSTGGAQVAGVVGMTGNSVLLSIPTSSVRQENGGQHASVSVGHSLQPRSGPIIGSSRTSTDSVGFDKSTAVFGGSKIVSSWCAGSANDASNVPSVHLGGIKSSYHQTRAQNKQHKEELLRSQQTSTAVTHVPWAMHQPCTSRGTLSRISYLRRRWGDEEDDDSDDDYPPIGGRLQGKIDTSQGETDKYEPGLNICKRHQGGTSVRERFIMNDDHNAGSMNTTGCTLDNILPCHSEVRYSVNGYQGSNCDQKSDTQHSSHDVDDTGHGQTSGRGYHPRDDNYERLRYSRGNETRNVSHCKNGAGDRWGKSRRGLHFRNHHHGDLNSSRWGQTQIKHSPPSDCFHSRDVSTACVLADCGNNSNNYRADRGVGEGHRSARKNNVRHRGLRETQYSLSSNRAVDGTRTIEVGCDVVASSSDMDQCPNQFSRDPDLSRYQGRPKAQLSKDSTSHVDQTLPSRKNMNVSTPMVLLRSTALDPVTTTTFKSLTLSVSVSSQATQVVSSTADTPTRLEQLDKYVRFGGSQLPAWQSASAAPGVKSSNLADERENLIVSSNSAVKQIIDASLVSKSRISLEQEKKDLGAEQQLNVLRQVAERRLAVASLSKVEPQHKTDSAAKWERGKKVLTGKDCGRGAVFLAKVHGCEDEASPDGQKFADYCKTEIQYNPEQKKTVIRNPCRKEGHHHEWKSCPKNPRREQCGQINNVVKLKLDGLNACRIEGHAHDWTNCPNNPKSELFIRNNPCLIEGHQHDWNDCRDNPKSENYSRPNWSDKRGHRSRNVFPSADNHVTNSTVENLTENGICGNPEFMRGPDSACDNDESEQLKPFAPARPPAASVWMRGPPTVTTQVLPPTEILHSSSPQNCPLLRANSTLKTSHTLESEIQSLLQSAPESLEQASPIHSQISQAQTNGTESVIFPLSALFPGNNALFGDLKSILVYGSWNPPPTVTPSCSFDPWKPNPFAPTIVRASPLGRRFGYIWGDGAVSLVTPQFNNEGRNTCLALKRDHAQLEPMPTEAMKRSAAPVLVKSLPINDIMVTPEGEKDWNCCLRQETGLDYVQ